MRDQPRSVNALSAPADWWVFTPMRSITASGKEDANFRYTLKDLEWVKFAE